MIRLVASLLLVLPLVFVTRARGIAAPPALTGSSAAACSTIGGTPRRMELSDGRIVSLDVRSLARSGDEILAAGRFGYVFPRDARSRTSPAMVDSILGVHIDGRGEVSLVFNPLLPRRAFHPRVTAAPDGSFHVLFATGLDTITWRPQPTDTVTLWYATYTRGWWSRPARVGQFAGAVLDPEHASALMEQNGELNIAFPFRDHRSAATDGGVILLRRRAGRWLSDTLRTWLTPAAVRAVLDRDGSLVTLLLLAEPSPDRYREKVFVARYDSAWNNPRLVGGDGVRHVTISALQRRQSDFIVSWIDWPINQPDSARLQWSTVDSTLRPSEASVIDSGKATFPFEMVIVDDRYPLWMYHGEPFGGTVNLVLNFDSVLTALDPLVTPFTSPIPSTLKLSGNRFLVFTQKRAAADTEPMAASFMTALEIRCPRSVQR